MLTGGVTLGGMDAAGWGNLLIVGLILLMTVVIILGKAFMAALNRQTAEPLPVIEETPAPAPEAPGAAGELKLHNVEPKTAAMIMAIVANKLGKPVNELRFLSIKEVDE